MVSMLSHSDVETFRRIWREEFGEDLSTDRAIAEAESLIALVYQLRKVHQRALRKEAQYMAQQSSGFDFETNDMVKVVPPPERATE